MSDKNKCPECGSPDYYFGAVGPSCINPDCRYYNGSKVLSLKEEERKRKREEDDTKPMFLIPKNTNPTPFKKTIIPPPRLSPNSSYSNSSSQTNKSGIKTTDKRASQNADDDNDRGFFASDEEVEKLFKNILRDIGRDEEESFFFEGERTNLVWDSEELSANDWIVGKELVDEFILNSEEFWETEEILSCSRREDGSILFEMVLRKDNKDLGGNNV